MNQTTKTLLNFSSLQEATGIIPFNMTNDYMFRAVLQSNNKVLCGLIRSLLHLPENIRIKAEITNPITLGQSLESKEFRLDINVILNDTTLLNLEMQIANKLNWQNRSISYLCRSFDQINHGEDYSDIKPAIHIGFLDYTLFENSPQFYATYKLMNTENHHIYSDNFDLRVLDLTQIHLATNEDKQFHIDYWAALFKAKTWEDIKMIAGKNEYLNEASKTIFQLSADDQIRKRCRDREEYYDDLRSYEHAIEKKDAIIAEKDSTIAEKDSTIAEKDAANAALLERIKELEAQLANTK